LQFLNRNGEEFVWGTYSSKSRILRQNPIDAPNFTHATFLIADACICNAEKRRTQRPDGIRKTPVACLSIAYQAMYRQNLSVKPPARAVFTVITSP